MTMPTGQQPSILATSGQQDAQTPNFIDVDLSSARTTAIEFRIPLASVLVGDPLAYDDVGTPSTTLFSGYCLIRPVEQGNPRNAVRLEGGATFRIPPTNVLWITNPAQASRMLRIYCLPLAYDLKYYQRFDSPFTGPASGGAVSVGTTATLIAASQPGRRSLLVKNANAAGGQTMFVGPSAGVTTANGLPVEALASYWNDANTAAWYGITAASTVDCRYIIEG